MIDPVLAYVMEQMAQSGFALPDPMTPQSMRAVLDVPVQTPPIPIADVRDVEVAGGDGPIAARLYHPHPSENRPITVFMHGGGWVVGTLDTHDGLARALAIGSDTAVLSLEYRLAPEHPYPAPLDDCVAAVRDLAGRGAEFRIDPDRYAIAGDSAGGNLAAALAIKLAGTKDTPVGQLLIYPVMDCNFDTRSYREAPEGGFLNTAMMRFFWDQYVGDRDPDGLAAPLRSRSLSGVAPATIILAGNDPLHDEGFAYAVALREAGVSTSLHDFAGGIHGFASLTGIAPIADEAIALGSAALRRMLH